MLCTPDLLQSLDISTNLDLDMGSDYRNVSISISYIHSKETCKLRPRSVNGWKSTLDRSRHAVAYHSHLHKFIYDYPSMYEYMHPYNNEFVIITYT